MEITFDPQFIPLVNALGAGDAQRVWKAVEKYQREPDTPGLNLEQLEGRAGRRRLCTIRASQELRVLLAREGPTSVFLRAGHHDDVYRFADRVAFSAPLHGRPGLIPVRPDALELDGSPVVPTTFRPLYAPAPERSILGHWTDGELAEAGFDVDAIERLRRATDETLLEVWPSIDDATFDRVFECMEQSPDAWRQRRLIADEAAEHKRFRDTIVERGALAGLSLLLTADEFERLRAAPIEEWMIFLHPDQHALVERWFNGPARVRGSAGTGKTVVALHRAAALAKRFATSPSLPVRRRRSPVLFTTYISSLPPVLECLYRRLPNAPGNVVEFINVDKLAARLCSAAGEPPRLDPKAATAAFQEAFGAVVVTGSPLHRARVTHQYLREEVTNVLKGRGIDTQDAYQAMERNGRRTRFTSAMREQTWRLSLEWDRRLADAGIEDFADVRRRARDLALRRQEPTYEAAVVDESQDLTLVGLQLVRALVNGGDGADRPDALFLVGDGAQKIYPGGFTLAQAGLDVRGNSAVLRLNYRNTRQIIDAAMACAGSEPVDDLGDAYRRGDADSEARRSGTRPQLVRAGDRDAQMEWVVKCIRRLAEGDGGDLRLGDIGVFAPDRALVDLTVAHMRGAALMCQRLDDFDGRPSEAVKVGTFHRAKGLEFKVVFLLDLSVFPRPKRTNGAAGEVDERTALYLSQLFVAMTRARDALFLLCNERPSEAVSRALDHLDDTVELS